MAYLRLKDYQRFIDIKQLDEVTDENDYTRVDLEPTSEEEAVSYLVQKYDTEREFSGLDVYNPTVTYKALSKVYLDADLYEVGVKVADETLVLGADGYVYLSNNGVDSDPIDEPSDWDKLGKQYTFFYGKLPFAEWDWQKSYKANVTVWYKDHTYISKNGSTTIAPDNEDFGSDFWTDLGEYTIALNTITDTSKWLAGDIRCQKLVECVVMLTLYKLYKHTASSNVPEWIGQSYDDSIKWLEGAGQGKFTPPLKELSNLVGHRIRITGNQKNVNIY